MRKQIYVMVHYNHPNELTHVSLQSLRLLKKCGVQIFNQTPLLKGINDDAYVLSDLVQRLSDQGVPTYYIFACRHTLGNIDWVLPLEDGFQIINEMKNMGTGLIKIPRFVMSDKVGKVEFIGMTDHHAVLRLHNMVNKYLNGEIVLCKRNANAFWMDDYPEMQACASYVREEIN
jgi:L-lysine 2,3-aminomutase